MKKWILIFLILFLSVNANDIVTLKSGRKVEGTAIIKGNEVHLIGKYGTIIFNVADVKVEKSDAIKDTVTDVSDKIDTNAKLEPLIKTVAYEITTRSGRKLIGNIFQKGDDIYLSDFGGIVKIDPFVYLKKESLDSGNVKGDIISGEKCNVVLKSGRAFSGIVEEVDGAYYVSSAIGTVKVEKKDLDHIEKTGYVLNLKTEREKLNQEGNTTAPAIAPKVEPVKKKDSDNLTIEEMVEINKKADEALKETKEAPKEIKIERENP